MELAKDRFFAIPGPVLHTRQEGVASQVMPALALGFQLLLHHILRGDAAVVAAGDPGMDDWNVPWSTYTAASALGGEITTATFAG